LLLLSSRRFSVGLSSSPELPLFPVLLVDEALRKLGLPLSFRSFGLRRFSSEANRDLTSSNSEVVTVYSAFAGRIFSISLCDAAMRSGVCGCDAKSLRQRPRLLLLHCLQLFKESHKRLRIVSRFIHVLQTKVVRFSLKPALEAEESYRQSQPSRLVSCITDAAPHENKRNGRENSHTAPESTAA